MKKIILIFIVSLAAACPAFAQNNIEAMRFLTVNALMQYGQRLYDRGDFNDASAVFDHVLNYDSHQARALQYLKEMGRRPPVLKIIVPVQKSVTKETSVAKTPATVDIFDNESLRRAIEAKKQSIAGLRSQIMQMRANIMSQAAANN